MSSGINDHVIVDNKEDLLLNVQSHSNVNVT